jgi:hypothetical protein
MQSLPRLGWVLSLLLLLGACSSSGPRQPPAPVDPGRAVGAADGAYLLAPWEGYDRTLAPETERALLEGRDALARRGRAGVDTARAAADEALAVDDGLPPALVLAAQADLVAGDARAALDRLEPVLAAQPGYTAAALVAGRAAEELTDVVTAYERFRAVAERNDVAARRAGELEGRAVEVVSRRVGEDLQRSRLGDAEKRVAKLEAWAPDLPVTLLARADLAAAQGNRSRELEAVRRLVALGDLGDGAEDDRALLRRQAMLELEVGDTATGLELSEELAERFPDDPALADQLAFARFRFRMNLLPEKVQAVAGKPSLERGDQALLLYWLFPQVRHARGDRPRIATDILDDPRRDEIARVLNLRLMDVDEDLHRFSPRMPTTRGRLLSSVTRVLRRGEPAPACVRDLPARPTPDAVCAASARCGLVPSPADCLAEGPVSGRDAVAVIQRALELSGAR